ncbi:MAG: hypothetical protein SEPTF4163_005988 [Sporothrix epigloea]
MAANDQSVRHLFDAEAEAASESTRFINSPSPTDKDHPAEKSATASSSSSKRTLAFTLVAGLAVSNALSLAVGAYAGRHRALMQQSLDTHCAAHTVQYSPLLDEVTIQYAPVTFNGSFLQETVYRRPAAPEVDAAWEALGVNYRAGVIPAAAGPRSGLTPDHVQRADRYGGGFLVNVEGMHHLHCLNLVRQSLYYNYPYYKDMGKHAFQNSDDILQKHVSHCIDILRQVLMCNFDTGVLGQVWYDPASPSAFPDFHTTHVCKNYDALRQWAEQLQAPPVDDLPADYLQPARPEAIWPSTP